MDLPERQALLPDLTRALVAFAHPDDAEFTAGATVAALVAAGVRVDYLVTTDGSKGSDDPTMTADRLAATRATELRAAADRLGVSEVVHLDYPDGELTPGLALRRDITRQLRHLRPELVITLNPQRRSDGNPMIGHPDHLATGEATLAAVYPAARDRLNFPELLGEGLQPWKVRQVLIGGVERPNLWVDVADHLETALAALRCHVSQLPDWPDVEARVRQRAAEAGAAVGLAAAQAFLSIVLP